MHLIYPVTVTSREIIHARSARRAVARQLLVVVALVLLITIATPQSGTAQIQVNTVNPGNTNGDACCLQEAIYATEFGANVALDQTDPDDTYFSGCTDPSGNWNTIVLQNVTYQFNQPWGWRLLDWAVPCSMKVAPKITGTANLVEARWSN